MADREVGAGCTIWADLPGLSTDAVTVTVSNAVGQVVLTESAATSYDEGRYSVALPADSMNISGLYTATWSGGGVALSQRFTVGPRVSGGITKHDLRIQAAYRVSKTIRGTLTGASEATLSDTTLIGGAGNYKGWWLVLGATSIESGKFKRVIGFNGSSLELSSPFVNAPAYGERYTLFEPYLSPLEIDDAINHAIADISGITRIPVVTSQVATVGFNATVPDGLLTVFEVWNQGAIVDDSLWSIQPGRQIVFSTGITLDATITVLGTRELEPLVWEDSLLDIQPGAVIARAAEILHASRAGGPGIDFEENLRRQLAAADEYERHRRVIAGRIANGSRSVLG